MPNNFGGSQYDEHYKPKPSQPQVIYTWLPHNQKLYLKSFNGVVSISWTTTRKSAMQINENDLEALKDIVNKHENFNITHEPFWEESKDG